jgi:hypothetical protein
LPPSGQQIFGGNWHKNLHFYQKKSDQPKGGVCVMKKLFHIYITTKIFCFFLLGLQVCFGQSDSDCNTVDLSPKIKWGRAVFSQRQSLGNPAKSSRVSTWRRPHREMPTYHQKDVGICYAYSAITMYDYWRQTRGAQIGLKVILSDPIYAALLTKKDLLKSPQKYARQLNLEGGRMNEVLEGIRKFGMCRTEVIQGIINKYTQGLAPTMDSNTFYRILQEMLPIYPDSLTLSTREDLKRFMVQWNNVVVTKLSKELPLKEISSIDQIPLLWQSLTPKGQNRNLTMIINNIFRPCEDPKNRFVGAKNLPLLGIYQENGPSKMTGEILRRLLNRQNPTPIALTYCANVLYFPAHVGMGKRTINDPYESCLANDTHASAIIGKKRGAKGECHFLLKNSHGTACPNYWECKYNSKKEATAIWVSEQSLVNNTLELVWFEEKGKKFLPGFREEVNELKYNFLKTKDPAPRGEKSNIACLVHMSPVFKDAFYIKRPNVTNQRLQVIRLANGQSEITFRVDPRLNNLQIKFKKSSADNYQTLGMYNLNTLDDSMEDFGRIYFPYQAGKPQYIDLSCEEQL